MNYGLDLNLEAEDLDGSEWVFGGASLPCLAQIPSGEREKYLPKGEVQEGKEDMMDCVTRGFINALETKFNFLLKHYLLTAENEKWLKEKGYVTENGVEFSDAFVAILSNTTRTGNSMKAPAHAIYKNGLVPKKMLPLEKTMNWDEYHNPQRITGKLRSLGKQFKARFRINYEIVREEEYEKELKNDILNVASYAWPSPTKGVYPRVEDPPNHAYILFDGKWEAFDNYVDPYDGDFIKNLAEDYDFLSYAYRIYISKEREYKNWLRRFLSLIF